MMSETRFTEFPALSVDPMVGISRPMVTEKFQSEGKRVMPETRFTEFPALSANPRVGISRSASETDD